jgi:hypothetical protein
MSNSNVGIHYWTNTHDRRVQIHETEFPPLNNPLQKKKHPKNQTNLNFGKSKQSRTIDSFFAEIRYHANSGMGVFAASFLSQPPTRGVSVPETTKGSKTKNLSFPASYFP